jgi:hypothetical protein
MALAELQRTVFKVGEEGLDSVQFPEKRESLVVGFRAAPFTVSTPNSLNPSPSRP